MLSPEPKMCYAYPHCSDAKFTFCLSFVLYFLLRSIALFFLASPQLRYFCRHSVFSTTGYGCLKISYPRMTSEDLIQLSDVEPFDEDRLGRTMKIFRACLTLLGLSPSNSCVYPFPSTNASVCALQYILIQIALGKNRNLNVAVEYRSVRKNL